MFPAGISGQFPEWSHFPQGNIVTLRMVSSTDLEVQVLTSSVELLLKASETVIPHFVRRALGLLFRMTSVVSFLPSAKTKNIYVNVRFSCC